MSVLTGRVRTLSVYICFSLHLSFLCFFQRKLDQLATSYIRYVRVHRLTSST
jgi:hypothetical protein